MKIEERKTKIISRELAKLGGDREKIAREIASQWEQFSPLLPDFVKGQHLQLLLSAVKYIRRHIEGKFDGASFVDAVFDAAQYGLAIDGQLGHALPFTDKKGDAKQLVFVPDYKGLVAVAKWRNLLRDVRAYVVHENDEFSPPTETPTGVNWSYQARLDNPGSVIGAIAILEFTDEQNSHCEWMPQQDLEKVRKAAKTDKIWTAWPDEMRKKSVIRRAFKLRRFDASFSALVDKEDDLYNEVIEVSDGKPEKKRAPKRAAPREVKAEAAPEPEPQPGPPPEAHQFSDDEEHDRLWQEWTELKTHQFSDDDLDAIREYASVESINTFCTNEELDSIVNKGRSIIGARK